MGCGSVDSKGEGPDGDGPGPDVIDPAAPSELAVDGPGPASYLAPGSANVTGKAVNLDALTVNGAPATLSPGTFTAPVTLQTGLNSFVASGTGTDGVLHRALRSALAGSFTPADGSVPGALQLHLGDEVLAGIGPLAGGLLNPADLSGAVTQGNPLIDDGTMVVNATGVAFDPAIVDVIPTDGALDVVITIPNFQVPLVVTTQVLFFDVDVDASLNATDLVITTSVVLGTDGQGNLTFDITTPESTVNGFEIVVDGLAGAFAGDAIDPVEAQAMLEDQLDVLLADLPAMADGLMGDMDLALETELLGMAVSLTPSFASAGVYSDGIHLGVDVALDVAGANPGGPGFLTVGAPPSGSSDAILVQVSDDFLNRAFYEIWAGGALNLELPIEPGGVEAALLTLLGGQPGVAGSLAISSALPPVMVERGGETRLQLGEMTMLVNTPGGEYGDQVELAMALDARLTIELTGEAAGLRLSGTQVTLAPVGDAAAHQGLIENINGIQTAVGLGMGMLNDMLSFPLVEEGAEPLTLPELTFVRDGSGKATNLELTVEDITTLIAVLTAVPVTTDPSDPSDPNVDPADPTDPVDPADPVVPPAPGGPMEVAIPSSTPVYDFDTDVTDDGASGWICRNDEVVATGDGGTWYVDDRGLVEIEGTGHTIYAIDNAEVILHTGGNTVYADPGADIEDLDGTNTIIEVDPLTFDTSTAPADGC